MAPTSLHGEEHGSLNPSDPLLLAVTRRRKVDYASIGDGPIIVPLDGQHLPEQSSVSPRIKNRGIDACNGALVTAQWALPPFICIAMSGSGIPPDPELCASFLFITIPCNAFCIFLLACLNERDLAYSDVRPTCIWFVVLLICSVFAGAPILALSALLIAAFCIPALAFHGTYGLIYHCTGIFYACFPRTLVLLCTELSKNIIDLDALYVPEDSEQDTIEETANIISRNDTYTTADLARIRHKTLGHVYRQVPFLLALIVWSILWIYFYNPWQTI